MQLGKRVCLKVLLRCFFAGYLLTQSSKRIKLKKSLMIQNCKETAKVVKEISGKYWPESDHFIQVRKLALGLFDGLIKWHHLSMRERCWLECATILHDIGLSKSRRGHHKKSAKLILNDTQFPFTSKERRIIANIARYHRKAFPKQNDHNLVNIKPRNTQ